MRCHCVEVLNWGMLIRAITLDALDERERKEAAAARRFPVSVSSEAPVARRGWDGSAWTEVLSHAAGAVDLSRAPLPVLEGHDRSKVNVGIVSNLRLDGARLRGELLLGASQRAKELADDIAAGVVRNVSVGYTVDAEQRDEKAKRVTATRWTPHEVSLVSVPADTTVGINRGAPMDPQNTGTPAPPSPGGEGTRAAPPASPEVLAERERIAAITTLVSRAELDDSVAANLITRGATLEQARVLVLDKIAERSEQYVTEQHVGFGEPASGHALRSGNDHAEDFRRAAVDSLLLRAGVRVDKPHAGARDVSPSVYDLARLCLSRAGKSSSRWLGGEFRGPELLKRAAGTGDFPAILEGALHASIRRGYEDEPASHRAWVHVASFSDFREASRPILGSAPNLAKINEHGEYTHGYFLDDGTKYGVSKYGKIVALSWEALVNDNLGSFLRVQPALGQAARRLEADLVYALLALNSGAGPAMQDAVNLFASGHANLTGSAAFDATQLGAGRALLRKQTAVGGGYLSLVPRFLIVPAERETAAEVILANATRRMTTEKTTPEWIANLELVVEPRLANTAVYLAADPNQIDTVELGLLEENLNGPHIETEQGFGTDEAKWKVRHAAGAKVLDWRGLVKMPVT